MSITVSYDITKLERSVTYGAMKEAQFKVAEQVVMDSERHVPQRGGTLVGTGKAYSGYVTWDTVYARAHYFGTNGIVTFRKYSVPGTGTKWVEKAAVSNMKNWEEVALKGLNLQ